MNNESRPTAAPRDGMPSTLLEMLATLVLACAAASSEAGEKVTLRLAEGRFLRAMGDGAVRPEGVLPAAENLFELQAHDGGTISLKAGGGRFGRVPDRGQTFPHR